MFMKNTLLLLLLLPLTASAQEEHIIYFDFDVAEANPLSAQSLKSWMDANKDSEVLRINGYTDAEGTDAYNQSCQKNVWPMFTE
jgi:outer membrane protein OmpA-like peptidoglycan-associated protein